MNYFDTKLIEKLNGKVFKKISTKAFVTALDGWFLPH